MYCPKCEKDIKPGTEIMHVHRAAQGVALGIGIGMLFGFSKGIYHAILGAVMFLAVLGFGWSCRQAVCPACKKVLLPENPFSEP